MKNLILRSAVVALVLMTACAVLAFAVNIPEPTGYVNDSIHALKQGTVFTMEQKCKARNEATSDEVAVLVVGSTAPLSIEQYGIKVGDKWKVGKKGKDNGIILIWAKTDRKVRIEVGRGAEASVPDFVAGRIINDIIIPKFKQGNFDDGMMAGLDAIMKEMK